MKAAFLTRSRLFVPAAWLFLACVAKAGAYTTTSPDHGQTFAYGMEQDQVFAERGRDHHLAVLLKFTNDPFVDRDHPRETDNFTFHFPAVTLGPDGRTFYCHAPGGHAVAVASKRPDFLGIDEIRLLPTTGLLVEKPHGCLTLVLTIGG